MSPIFKITLLVLAVLLIVGLVVAHFSAPYIIIKRARQASSPDETPAKFGLDFEKISIKTVDNLHLQAFYIPSALDDAYATILLLHGIGSRKENLLPLAAFLANEGYNCLALDSRAHGESEGNYITFGYFEKQDISSVIDYLEKEKGLTNIGIRGTSMGGAIALLSLAHDKRLKFGIIESTFADLSQVVFDYQKLWLGLESRIISNYTLQRAAKIAKFTVKEIKPAEVAKEVTQPVFYAHGDADENISVEYGKEIFKNLASSHKEMVIVEEAGHENLAAIGGVDYRKRMLAFLEKYRGE